MAGTIAAVATPLAPGGLSVIRISGPDAFAVADRVFFPVSGEPLSSKKGYTASFGAFSWKGKKLDDGVALVFRAPKSYTGEDVVELSCHGGVLLTQEILRSLLEAGASLAGPGEFTKRAYLNGKLSLTQAEAVVDLIQARSGQSLSAARAQLDGALSRRIERIKERLLDLTAHLAGWVDYPEEDLPEIDNLAPSLAWAREELTALLDTFSTGRLLREGISTVICGKPNVGKSTLMNLLSGCSRSIVTEIPGTTRDVVEETVQLSGIPLRLWDTAGLRDTADPVERIGVGLAQDRLESADLVLAVFDCSVPLSEEDRDFLQRLAGKRVVAVANKADLPHRIEEDVLRERFDTLVFLSALEEESLQTLSSAIRQKVGVLDAGAGILATERQRDCALRARDALEGAIASLSGGMTLDAVTVEVEEALSALLELSGGRVTEEVVDRVFSNFCVGK